MAVKIMNEENKPDKVLNPVNLQHLRKLMANYFSMEELKSLCFDLGLDFDELGGEGKSNKIRSLINRMKNHGQLSSLVKALAKERPGIAWPGGSYNLPCPYRGLSAFREADASNFFGRESYVEQLINAVSKKPLLALVGSSGSGKSSVIFAGLIPKLQQQDNWLIASMRPGTKPFFSFASTLLDLLRPDLSETEHLIETPNLANALKNKNISLSEVVERIFQSHDQRIKFLIVVDQFEELYTLVPEIETRHRFIDNLLEAFNANISNARQCRLVLTLRADFMGQALLYPPLVEAIQNNDLKLGPMTQDELRKAIQEPARRVNVTFETSLVERILEDVGIEGNNLALLQFALTRLWEHQTNINQITHIAYESIGQVKGALTGYAEEIYSGLSNNDQQRMQRVFLQLVHPGRGTEDTRRVAKRPEFSAESWELVQRLADTRLLVTDRDEENHETVELVHEALVQCWGRLQDWMKSNKNFRLWQEHLRTALHYWEESNHSEGALLTEFSTSDAFFWLDKRKEEISQKERDFINESLKKLESRREKLAEERVNYQKSLAADLGLATLGTTMAAIQHRINNTLNIVSPNITRLRRRIGDDQEAHEILDIMERNVRYTSQIINRIQDALRGERQVLNINHILSEVAHSAKQEWQSAAVESVVVNTEFDDNIPDFEGPISQLTDVFTNLATNAIRAMPNGGSLEISSKLVEETIHVTFTDTGQGIPSNIVSRLFTRPVPTRESGGTSGLGLYLGALIIESLGGSIEILETSTKGTTVLIKIPLPKNSD